ncbi:hypothetical protein [Streptomyces sp. NPDC002088]|uniref:hypothetical protein n=1 Tax=Streptomyces sp. NPDC002088 TaxID=3154665 RepID=UPI0033245113
MEWLLSMEGSWGHGLGHRLAGDLVRSHTRQGYQAVLGGIHARKPYLAPCYEADGFRFLPPGAPLDPRLPVGRLRYPAEPSMRHLMCPLSPAVSYRAGELQGLSASRLS